MELLKFAQSYKGMFNPFVTEASVIYQTNQPKKVAADIEKFINENSLEFDVQSIPVSNMVVVSHKK